MIEWKFLLLIFMRTVHFLSTTLDDIGDACSNVSKVFSSSASSEDKSEDNPEVLKVVNKKLSKLKQISKAIKFTGTAGVDLALDGSLILLGQSGDFRKMAVGKFASFLGCDPESYQLLPQIG